MIVVCDTSPLTNLAAIGQFDLLRRLYTEIHIADGVWDELNVEGKRWPGADNVAASGFGDMPRKTRHWSRRCGVT